MSRSLVEEDGFFSKGTRVEGEREGNIRFSWGKSRRLGWIVEGLCG